MKHEKYIYINLYFLFITLKSQIFIIHSNFSKIDNIEWVMLITYFFIIFAVRVKNHDEIYQYIYKYKLYVFILYKFLLIYYIW